ncbi:hypothetical protein NQ315_004768 [Exocentrus adspersus]|uniref:Uncharacterized protein n=1 Tax=Exocentrus adspersus TaxID=1586481 RepID=A0AAV8W2D5_9CUCU|nr:hypothetical protein NQ315_004768 [Exocentrus adspersus]
MAITGKENDNGVTEFQFYRPENRTKWQNFQRAIYDPQSKQCLGRTPKNWGAALILGGVDVKDPPSIPDLTLWLIRPFTFHNNEFRSGSLAAMSVFESGWKPDLDEEAGVQQVRNSIAAGVFNDLGSGSNIDSYIIRKGATDYRRTYDEANKKGISPISQRNN